MTIVFKFLRLKDSRLKGNAKVEKKLSAKFNEGSDEKEKFAKEHVTNVTNGVSNKSSNQYK